jgi:hypothetical protein
MATARVVLCDPQKIGESAIGAYVSYKLSAEVRERRERPPVPLAELTFLPQLSTKLQGLDSLTYTVIRRFSDFFWLRTQLRDAFPFLIVPALPEKQQMGRFNQEFIDVRMRALQRWIDRIAANPQLVSTGECRPSAAAGVGGPPARLNAASPPSSLPQPHSGTSFQCPPSPSRPCERALGQTR